MQIVVHDTPSSCEYLFVRLWLRLTGEHTGKLIKGQNLDRDAAAVDKHTQSLEVVWESNWVNIELLWIQRSLSPEVNWLSDE